jgi:hypothetical protein
MILAFQAHAEFYIEEVSCMQSSTYAIVLCFLIYSTSGQEKEVKSERMA